MTTWWREHNEMAETFGAGTVEPLAPHLIDLLDDVEARFVVAGGEALAWPDPHGVPGEPYARRDTLDEEYSRVTNPAKYGIVEVRLRAWFDALTHAGLGEVVVEKGRVGWPGRDDTPVEWCVVRPLSSDGGATLHVALWRDESDGWVGVEVGAGDPPLVIDREPDCGCDACDGGSESLLQSLDESVLSIVDGSIEVTQAVENDPSVSSRRTSFSGGFSDAGSASRDPERVVVGRSWWPQQPSRRLMRW